MKALAIRLRDDGKETLTRFFLFEGLDMIYSCCFLEPPLKGNAHNVSCLPARPDYFLQPRSSAKFGNHLEIAGVGVGDRAPVLIHNGNYLDNTKGCQLVGKEFLDLNGDKLPDVTDSKKTLAELVALVKTRIPYVILDFTG